MTQASVAVTTQKAAYFSGSMIMINVRLYQNLITYGTLIFLNRPHRFKLFYGHAVIAFQF